MKCIAAVVMMAFVATTQAGLAPLALSSHAAWASPLAAPWAWGAPTHGITQYSSLGHAAIIPGSHAVHASVVHAPAAHWAAPVAHAAHWGAPAAHWAAPAAAWAAPIAHAAVIPHEAQYTAVNRGSVHTAPLPGHALSQTSLNVAPAPGTL